jgi:hypothetical protein
MSFMTFRVKIKYFENSQMLTGWQMLMTGISFAATTNIAQAAWGVGETSHGLKPGDFFRKILGYTS